MLRAFAEAGRVLAEPTYIQAAINNAQFLLSHMRRPDGTLHRTWKPGHEARLNGYLEDYANVADGLVALYEATFEPKWLDAATELADAMLARFADADNGGFFDTSSDHEQLITRPKDLFDNATPSGNAVAADVLLRLSVLTDNDAYRAAAQGVLALLQEPMARYPLGFARSLSALDFLLGTAQGDRGRRRPERRGHPGPVARRVRAISAQQGRRGHRRRSGSREHPAPRSPRATRRQANGLRLRALRVSGADH